MKIITPILLFLFVWTLPATAQVTLPVTFEDAIDYGLTDFGGNMSSIVADPTDPNNTVAQSIKGADAELWAGTTIGGDVGFDSAIPFSATATKFTVRVWSPDAGITIRLKVEDAADPGIFVEKDAPTTVAMDWETIEFDLSNPTGGAINLDNTYDKLSIFFNFGTTGADAGEKTYYWDDVIFIADGPAQVDLPVTFEDANVDYLLTDFGGNASSIVVDPTDANNMVAQSIKGADAELWAGTTVGGDAGFATAVPFTADDTKISVRVWSPDAGITVRLKVEDAADPGIFVEKDVPTTVAMEWETLEFDLSDPTGGAINLDNTYDKLSIFFNFGTTGADAGEKTYYWDDVEFVEDNSQSAYCATEVQHLGIPAEIASAIFLTITNVDATSMLVEIESANDDPVDFLLIPGGSGAMISPEDFSIPGKISRTLSWMDPPEDVVLNVLWSKESTDGNWQLSPMDITVPFAASCPDLGPDPVTLPITFEDPNVDYALADFGGNTSSIVADPTDASNTVVQSIKGDMAELWAGTTVGNNGFAAPVPFTATATKMSVRVWSPDAGITVRLKVEDAADPGIFVEKDVMTTVAMEWETLEFDFSNPTGGAINLDNTYDKASIFFNFGTTGAEQGEKTYYWDDVEFVEDNSQSAYCATEVQHLGIPAEMASAIFLTITNVDANTMLVEIESANDDPVDFLLIANGSGAMISEEDFSVPGKISRTLTWMDPPEDVVLNVLWSKESTDGNWQLSPDDISVPFIAACPPPEMDQVDLPITFEDANVDYALADFGGNTSTIVVDPTDAGNTVVQSIKGDMAELWAGTTVGNNGFANPIPFNPFETKLSVRVWSPDAGIPVRLKVEDANDAAISVETEAMTTVAEQWETLEFDFTNQVDGTPVLSFDANYTKASIFFNFGTTGAEQGEKTYYWDDVEFVPSDLNQIDLPVTFEEDDVFYNLVDFGGNISLIVEDPTDATNTVAQTIRTAGAETFAGTTLGGDAGFANPIPFTAAATKMSVRVWSPAAGVPVRLKVENIGDSNISVETETTTTVAMEWETLEFDFSAPVPFTPTLNLNNTYSKAIIFFNFGAAGADEQIYYWDDVQFIPSDLLQIDLPVTFEEDDVFFNLIDFAGNATQIVEDPTDASNTVAQTIRTANSEVFAGTTMGAFGFANPIPFSPTSTKMSVRVWSPLAGIPVRLKVENAADGAISVETETSTTVAMDWETIEFDFTNPVEGTPSINFANTYSRAIIFFNFGAAGADEQIYFWDDVQFVPSDLAQIDLPVTFEEDDVLYDLVDFAGAASSVVEDPTDATNTVAQTIRTDGSATFAGTSMGIAGFANAIPFTDIKTKISVRVWSPDEGVPIRLKVENSTNGAISVETETSTNVEMDWEVIEFDFANEVEGTAPLDLNNVYDKATIFFNFGAEGGVVGEQIYYWDDVELIDLQFAQIDLPVTFEDPNVDYDLTDFGGNTSQIVVDPTDPNNTVAESVKGDDAELWAGTTMGNTGFDNPVPFVPGATTMTVRVWSPDAGIPVRLKVEDNNDPAISVETEALTTVAEQWETLEFDFSNPAEGTPAINFDNTYDKASIFFNFGTTGADAGTKTYYWDDVQFIPLPPLDQIDLPVTFEEANTDYTLVDFGGNASQVVADPADPANTVAQSIKTSGAELWAGTTMGPNGFANPVPFAPGDTKMTVWVWSPDANIPIRLKVEDNNDPGISVETEATITVAEQWQKLEFDFSNPAEGTAEINFDNTYDKASIFFNFGTTGAAAGEKTYYWDDVEFGGLFSVMDIIAESEDHTLLETAILTAELDGDLSAPGTFTVFAPTDDAFNALARWIVG